MLSTLLYRSGLSRQYPEGPPELDSSLFPLHDLQSGPGFLLTATFLYNSQNIFKFPHRLCLPEDFLDEKSPTLGLDDRVTIRVARSLEELIDEDPEFSVLEAWIIGVHFEIFESVEFTLLGMFDGTLQVIFLEVPRRLVDRVNTLPNTMRYYGMWYWTYMPSIAIEARAKAIQNVGDDLEEWSYTYRTVHHCLMELRTKCVAHFVCVDPACFEDVRT